MEAINTQNKNRAYPSGKSMSSLSDTFRLPLISTLFIYFFFFPSPGHEKNLDPWKGEILLLPFSLPKILTGEWRGALIGKSTEFSSKPYCFQTSREKEYCFFYSFFTTSWWKKPLERRLPYRFWRNSVWEFELQNGQWKSLKSIGFAWNWN